LIARIRLGANGSDDRARHITREYPSSLPTLALIQNRESGMDGSTGGWAGWATAAIAAIVGGIAWEQWQVAKAKLKLELFEQRYELFVTLWTYFTYVADDKPTADSAEAVVKFRNAMPRAHFLFGETIGLYFEESHRMGIAYRAAMRRLRDTAFDACDRKASEAEVLRLSEWFSDALKGMRPRFSKHMDFGAWS
jgi:hypothetical protein